MLHADRQEGAIPRRVANNTDRDEAALADPELLIRQTFTQDPRVGCELLFRLYYQPLCSHAVRFVGARDIAQDLVSDVFCQFYANQTFAQITSSYRAYLYQTVRHQAYNYLRWEVSRQTDLTSVGETTISESQQPDTITQYEELYQDVESAINSLPLQRRKIYLMHRFEGKKYTEIADELHVAPKTVEVQIRKASHYLRNLLRSKWTLSIISLLTLLV